MATAHADSGTSPGLEATSVNRGVESVSLSGWAVFAGVMLIVVGAFNLIQGFVAIDKGNAIDASKILYTNLDAWGWAFLVWGALQFVAGCLALGNRMGGKVMGTILASISMLLWFFLIFAAPIPALIGILMNVGILYGLTSMPDDEVAAY